MGHVFDFHDTQRYAHALLQEKQRNAADLESRLMLDMLNPQRGDAILDIGCGTGASIAPLLQSGLDITGIDPSPYMLDIAAETFGEQVELYRGFAEDLPFDDNAFNHACIFTTLEYVDAPAKAIEEACRVAKDKVFIGVLNRYALKSVQRRLQGIFTSTIYNRARFFSVWELKSMVRDMAGPVPVAWRTVQQFTGGSGKLTRAFERSHLVQRCPFGAFAGMVVTLVPRFRTRPLAMRYRPKNTRTALGGT